MKAAIKQPAEIVTDAGGNRIVKINNIIFRGKQNIDWKAVEIYLQRYIGKFVVISDQKVWISREFTDEYAGSEYTRKLRGGLAKAKANAVQGIFEMMKIAILKRKMENKKEKHKKNARFGWQYYVTRFAIPIYDEQTEKISYNCYKATMIIQHSGDGKLYLYDIQEIKKETSNPPSTFRQEIQEKSQTRFCRYIL